MTLSREEGVKTSYLVEFHIMTKLDQNSHILRWFSKSGPLLRPETKFVKIFTSARKTKY